MVELKAFKRRNVVIGVDIGTTSTKAVLFDCNGGFIFQAEEKVTTLYPEQGYAEQGPEEIERKTKQVLRQVIEQVVSRNEKLLAIGLATAMHSLICVDEKKQALSNAIIWSDSRSSKQASELNNDEGKEFYCKTGTPIHPMSPFLNLIWMKETEYYAYQEASYFMTIKDYLVWKWFDERWIDEAMASSTGLYNLKKHAWDRDALQLAGITEAQLSKIVSPDTVLTSVQIAKELGIGVDIPFIIGSADGQLANLGDGMILPGEVAISVGTSGAIRQFIDGTEVDPFEETFTYAFTKETSIVGGPTNNGGIVLQWLKNLLEFEGSDQQLIALSDGVKPGADGLFFLPYINGERAPFWNQDATGSFVGLTIRHKKEHLVKAVLEGICFNLYHIGESLERVAGVPKQICANGGLTQSEKWVQILADVFGKEIHLSETHHSVAWGAAWTALFGIKEVASFAAIKEKSGPQKVVQTIRENHQQYRQIYQKYRDLTKLLS
ncbi:gluconokinase [Paraliobacillus sp. X-1268]|uniref:gluconokinase n=1 Tax=Paraliobacillus sp. X-1268 TaxID=2213193 RepID=UPI000E3CB05D|nr:gluconokinase [Paraliobacillus sp. X-1268]